MHVMHSHQSVLLNTRIVAMLHLPNAPRIRGPTIMDVDSIVLHALATVCVNNNCSCSRLWLRSGMRKSYSPVLVTMVLILLKPGQWCQNLLKPARILTLNSWRPCDMAHNRP